MRSAEDFEPGSREAIAHTRRLLDKGPDRLTAPGREAFEASLNTSGVIPLDLRVVVHPDPVEERTKGGIILPDETKERDKYATVKATLIAVGENAWEEAAARSDKFTRPQPGDRIMIAKYGGVLFKGTDGKDYRIMNDEDVVARLEE